MTRKQALDDPQIGAAAWARFRRIMRWMALAGAGCVVLALGLLYLHTGFLPLHMVIATSLGIWISFMLGTGLMALTFLSHGTGHDDQVIDRMKDEELQDD